MFDVNPVTGDGKQHVRVAEAVAADDAWLITGVDTQRFRFEIITSGTEALNLQATGGEGKVDLSWTQDDFDLLAGFHVYRSTEPETNFSRINPVLVPDGVDAYVDDTVSPGQEYFYAFTVVKTDFTESGFSNIANATPTDTIPPVVDHDPIAGALAQLPLTFAADITDNVGVDTATLFYRTVGEPSFASRAMVNTTGDRYTATLESSNVNGAGLEYYIEAFDGISTERAGRPELPFTVAVDDSPVITTVSPSSGPASGGTTVTVAGSNFQDGAAVAFGGIAGTNVDFVSDTQVTVVTPSHIPLTVDVSVINPNDDTGVALNAFTFESDVTLLSLPDVSALQNDIIQIPLSVINADGLAAVDLTIDYNAGHLSLQSVTLGSLAGGWSIGTNTQTPGEIQVAMASPGGSVSGSGGLLSLEFQILGAPDTESDLTFTDTLLNDGAISPDVEDGSVTVGVGHAVTGNVTFWSGGGPVPGAVLKMEASGVQNEATDASGDFVFNNLPPGDYTLTPSKDDDATEITAFDASLVLQHAVQLITLDGSAAVAADVNDNGLINSTDAFFILEKSAGLRSLPFPGAGAVWVFDPENRSLPGLADDVTGQDFTGILLGDVSGNWSAEVAAGSASIVQANGSVRFGVTTAKAANGDLQISRVLVQAGADDVFGVDLKLTFDGRDVLVTEVSSDASAVGNANTEGIIRAAVADANGIRGDAVLLTVTLDTDRLREMVIESVRSNEGGLVSELGVDLAAFDSDGDGLIDIDEEEIFGTDKDKAASDGDGQSDGFEIRAGTDPGERGSVFRVNDVVAAEPGVLEISWPTVSGVPYQLQKSATLTDASWENVGEPIIGSGATLSVGIEIPEASEREFYRIVVVD
jgi:hypothetical protein